MKIKNVDILNSNDYDSLYIDSSMIIAGRLNARDSSNFIQIGSGFVDDEFMNLSGEEQARLLVEDYLLHRNINGIFQSKYEFSVLANRKLVLGDRDHIQLERLILDKYHADRLSFLTECIDTFDEYYFYGRQAGYSFYDNMCATDSDTPEFTLASKYTDHRELVYLDDEKQFFFEAVDMIAGDKEVVLNIESFIDENGEDKVKGSTILDGTNTIHLHYLLTDLAVEAVTKHNEKVKGEKKLQMKMEGF